MAPHELSMARVLKSLGCTWLPRQREACAASDRYPFVLYGGSRGPGKSYWLRWYLVRLHLWWASQGHSGIRTMLACEDYPSLYDRQIVKIVESFPPVLGTFIASGVSREFRFVNELHIVQDGQRYTLPLGGAICLRNLDDPERYQSAEFAAIAVDELTKIRDRRTFDVLRASRRWPGLSGCRFIAASNPTGPGVQWVRQLWLENKLPPEYAKLVGQFAFIRGLPADNPYLDAEYWLMLHTLPPVLQKAWELGDWYAGIEGSILPDFASGPGGNVTAEAEFVPGQGGIEWWLDDGFSAEHPLYCGLVQMMTNDDMHLFDEYLESFQQHPDVITALLARGYPKPDIARIPSEAGRLAACLHAAGIKTARSTHPVEEGIRVLRLAIGGGNLRRRLLLHPRCRLTIQSLSDLPADPARNGRPLKINGVPGDHPADGCRYGAWWYK